MSDSQITVLVDGSGNCIEIEDGLVAIGSGGLYAQSAATGMMDNEMLTAEDVATKAMRIAADLCVYTNHTTCMEVLSKTAHQTLSLGNPSPATTHLLKFLEVTYDSSDSSSLSDSLQDSDTVEISGKQACLKYLCRKYMPELLGRSAAELGKAEMIATMVDSNLLEPVVALILSDDCNKFIAGGEQPTFADFCVFAALSSQADHDAKV